VTQAVAICNQKGGVGKTTLAINLGAALTAAGDRVLLVDLDPQGHLTDGVGLGEHYLQSGDHTLYAALVGKHQPPPQTLIARNQTERFDVIPATYELTLAEQGLYMSRNREHKLAGLLSPLRDSYDWILIDCPPVLGNLTDNALNTARQVLVPIQAEATSVRALELLFDQIESVERGLSIRIGVLAVVPNLVQDSILSKQILEDLREAIPVVTPFEIRKRVLLQAAWRDGKSAFTYHATTSAEERTRRELTELYTDLAALITQRTREAALV
jgi:chromosome partitioning protein